jgi:hypothetical protein
MRDSGVADPGARGVRAAPSGIRSARSSASTRARTAGPQGRASAGQPTR